MKIDQVLKQAKEISLKDNYLKDMLNDYELTNDKTLKESMQQDILDYTNEILRTKDLK